jgi:AbrB family looped-hinge helix DNA binding protein
MEATITNKGQVTIPKAVREALRLRGGDRVDFQIGKDGSVRFVAVGRSVTALKGMLPKPRRPVTLEQMDDAIGGGATRK